MSEYRQDATSGAWVIIAPERGRRPSRPKAGAVEHLAERPGHCPFCPGNEHLLPPIVEQVGGHGEHDWYTRVVPNKHPALKPAGDSPPVPAGPQQRLAGFGYHEVIVESPRHAADLTSLAEDEMMAVARTWHGRFAELSRRPGIEATFLFRNRGHDAGASLTHPHSQVIATAIIPPWVAVRTGWARDRFKETGLCPTCEEIGSEAVDGRRVVERTRRFLVTVPFAASSPYLLRITPFRHEASFADAEQSEIDELGLVLRRALTRLEAVLGEHAYNLVVASATPHGADAVSDHWSLTVVPSLLHPGGFEIGSGLPINPSSPEGDAAELRQATSGIPIP